MSKELENQIEEVIKWTRNITSKYVKGYLNYDDWITQKN